MRTHKISDGGGMTRNSKKHRSPQAAAAIMLSAVFALILGGCGGGGNAALGALQVAQVEHGKKDQPVIPVPYGHPNRIVFVSDRDSKLRILAMDSAGGNISIVAENPENANPAFTFAYPAMSHDGLTSLFNSNWYATAAAVVSVQINGTSYHKIAENFDTVDPTLNFEAPRSSWSDKKIAFAAYSETQIVTAIAPSSAHVTTSVEGRSPDLRAQFGVIASGSKLTAYKGYATKSNAVSLSEKLYSNATDTPKGIAYVGSSITEGSCSSKTYSQLVSAAVNSYYCLNIDYVNYIVIKITERTSTTDANQLLKFEWHIENSGATPVEVVFSKHLDTDGTTLLGEGYNFIADSSLRKYDIFSYPLDGSSAPIQHTDDNDPDRFPCFSPLSDNYVYVTHGSFSGGGTDYDMPSGMNIYRFDLTNNTYDSTPVITDTTLNKHCSVSPSGKMIAYSHFNGLDYDVYLYDMTQNPPASRVLASDKGNDLFPVFSPGGNVVAFQSDLTGNNDIYVVNIYDGNPPINLTNNYDINDYMPAWAP